MAITASLLFRGNAVSGTNTTLYSGASNTVVTNIVATNTTTSGLYFTINLAISGTNYAVVNSGILTANNSTFIDLKQYLPSGQLVTGYASASGVVFHISGVTGV